MGRFQKLSMQTFQCRGSFYWKRKEKWSENRENYLWNRKMGALSSRRKCLKNKHDENEIAKLKFQSEWSEHKEQMGRFEAIEHEMQIFFLLTFFRIFKVLCLFNSLFFCSKFFESDQCILFFVLWLFVRFIFKGNKLMRRNHENLNWNKAILMLDDSGKE